MRQQHGVTNIDRDAIDAKSLPGITARLYGRTRDVADDG
jgi:hypothetical protein